MEATSIIRALALDHKTSLIYWATTGFPEIWQRDLDGNNQQLVNISSHYVYHLAALDNILLWKELADYPDVNIFPANIFEKTKKPVFNVTHFELADMEALPPPEASQDWTLNPCAGHSCSHLCVQSTDKRYACLCPDDYALSRDGHHCTLGSHFTRLRARRETERYRRVQVTLPEISKFQELHKELT